MTWLITPWFAMDNFETELVVMGIKVADIPLLPPTHPDEVECFDESRAVWKIHTSPILRVKGYFFFFYHFS